MSLCGAGEGALLVAEQLRLDQILRDRRAVDLDEGALGALAVVVERVGDQLLAGAVLPLDQDVRIAARHALDQLEHFVHLLALADDVAEAELPLELLLEQEVLADEIAALDRALEHLQQRIGLDGLLDEAVRARLHRLDGLDDAAVAGDHDDLGVGVDLLEFPEQLEAVRVGQHHVGHDDVGLPGLEDLFAACADHRGPDLVALVLEQDLQPLDHRRFVVDGEYPVALLDGHSFWSTQPARSACGGSSTRRQHIHASTGYAQISIHISTVASICRHMSGLYTL